MSDSANQPPPPDKLDSHNLSSLVDQLHAANQHFATARKHLETALDCAGWDCPNPEVAEEELRAAQREVDAISARIDELLKRR